jgi:hypothetical protein
MGPVIAAIIMIIAAAKVVCLNNVNLTVCTAAFAEIHTGLASKIFIAEYFHISFYINPQGYQPL